MPRFTRPMLALALAGVLLLPACGRSQRPAAPARPAAPDTTVGDTAMRAMHESMSGPAMASPHMRLTPERPATAADSARAERIVAALRDGIARYADVRVAEADGYRPFLPNVPQRVYHYTSGRRAIGEAFRFDPARPTSLLYERRADGRMMLVGAMYTAPRRASLDALDARVPLGIARWHEHVDICLPPRGQPARWAERVDGQLEFGPAGAIATREACDAAGGRFMPVVFGWMVHVHPFAATPAEVWSGEHAMPMDGHH